MEAIEGTVEAIVYRNESNGYTVCDVMCGNELVTVVGHMPYLNEGESLKAYGRWTSHPEYGDQFKAESYEKQMPQTDEAIERYLASGIIKGIGPSTAKKIVDTFGNKALEEIRFNPQRLTSIKGISMKKALEISQALEEQRELVDIVMFFQKHGLGPSYSVKIYRSLGSSAINTVRSNPYILCECISGIGFRAVDRIAMNMGAEKNSRYRVAAGIKYVLSNASASGHTYLPCTILCNNACSLLEVGSDSFDDALAFLRIERSIYIENKDQEARVYLMPFYLAERNAGSKLAEMLGYKHRSLYDESMEIIESFETNESLALGSLQREAISEAVSNGLFVITGGPGTGKTTIIKCIIEIFEKNGLQVALAAPTGRAAKRMCQATGREAKTIHRLLEITFTGDEERQIFIRNEENPVDADVIIVDEMSMVDALIFNSLLKAITPGKRLIMAGDADQLPSVGPGNVLKDIIASDTVKTVRLTEIYRQAQTSGIIVNAHRINRGDFPVTDEFKDFYMIRKAAGSEILNSVIELCTNRLPSAFGYDPLKHIQVLTPVKKGITGVINLNCELQKAINPSCTGKNEKELKGYIYREGDRVMQVKNNYSLKWEQNGCEGEGIFNGDTGIISRIDMRNNLVSVSFDDEKNADYDMPLLEQLEPAYAVTIHKSQGNEFPVVIIPMYPGPSVLMTRNLLYTAITRAKDIVILAGHEQVLKNMTLNASEIMRYTGFKEKLAEGWFIRSDCLS